MENIWKVLRDSLPEAIGGICVAIIIGIATVIWSKIQKRRKNSLRENSLFDVYLSYPAVDRLMVKQFVYKLEDFGVKVFYDLKIKAGEDFQKVLDREMRRTPAIGFCITPATQSAQGVLDEISKAVV